MDYSEVFNPILHAHAPGEGVKKCNYCEQYKLITEFYKIPKPKQGKVYYDPKCKACRSLFSNKKKVA